MKIGYIKISPGGQISDESITQLKKEGVEKIILGLNNDQNQYNDMLLESIDTMNDNDVLIINTLDDAGESIADIIKVLKKLIEKNIILRILDSSFKSEDIYDPKLNILLSNNTLEVLKWVENKEQRDIQRRQFEAVQMIKATKQVKGSGRPKKYAKDAKNPKNREIYFNVVEMLNNDIPIKRISETLNIARNTIYAIKEELDKHTDND